jgi:hypothetical protein
MERLTHTQDVKRLKQVIPFKLFINQDQNSLSWYDVMPLDGAAVSGIPYQHSIYHLRDKLLKAQQPDPNDLNILAALLLGQGDRLHPPDLWSKLAELLSLWMANELTGNGNRLLRMQAARLNYYIEALISNSEDYQNSILAEHNLPGSKPWDYVEHQESSWWISSGSPSLYRQNQQDIQTWHLALPTQLDPLPDGRLAVGSIYSHGAMLGNGHNWQRLEHSEPVPLVFQHEKHLYFLDHFGRIWRDSPREYILSAACRQVHFARYSDGRVYCLDNSDYGHITIIEMGTNSYRRQSVLPVRVCNDITFGVSCYYLIDKQQGSVFKFDQSFTFLSRVLSFGRGKGCLLDPVAIHADSEKISIVSWLSNKLTTIGLF